MANNHRISGELEIKIREMCEKGYNATHIGKQFNISKTTVGKWAIQNGFNLSKNTSSKTLDLEPKIIEMLKMGIPRKIICSELKVHFDTVTRVAAHHGLTKILRNPKENALLKILSKEEVESRIPDNSRFLHYDETINKYVFLCTVTNKEFSKSTGKIDQGSPYGKSGKQLTELDFIEKLKSMNYTIKPGTFTKTKEPVIVYCPKGHERVLSKANYALKFNCPTCGNNGTSGPEQEILAWVRQFYPNAYKLKLPGNITKHKEIDIYIPELKLGIEYCGLYYHKEDVNSSVEERDIAESKHYKKMLIANSLGIELITIFGDEWESNGEQIRGFLKSKLQSNKYKIQARQCNVVEINKKDAKLFLDNTHIQGADESIVYFGLYFKGDLAGVISGGRHPHRHVSDDKSLYLNRLAFSYDLTVSGGASKLLSHLIKYAKSNGFNKIISWSDNRWSNGGIYKTLGFQFDSQLDKGRGLSDGSIWPDYTYVYRGKRITRHVAKSNNLIELELDKVWDCGKKKWQLYL